MKSLNGSGKTPSPQDETLKNEFNQMMNQTMNQMPLRKPQRTASPPFSAYRNFPQSSSSRNQILQEFCDGRFAVGGIHDGWLVMISKTMWNNVYW